VTQSAPSEHLRALFGVPVVLLAFGCTATIDGNSSSAGGQTGTGAAATTGGSGSVGQGGASSGGTGGQSGGQGGTQAGGTGATGSGGTLPGTGGSAATGGTAGAAPSGIDLDGRAVYYRVVRLTHSQWEASTRDLLKLDALPGLSTGFVGDPPEGTFSNNERALYVTSTLWTDYQRAAETLATQIAGNAQAITRVTGGTTDAATFIRTFGRRIFRRPLTTTEEQKYQALFTSGPSLVASGDAFADGVRMVIEAMLQSPNFVYRSELGTDGAPLSGYEMASKLSFLLRNTTPDDALLDAAAAGELDTSSGVISRATAMLEEDSAQVVVGRYHAELFGIDRYTQIDKNRTTFPTYDPALNPELVEADQLFFDRIFSTGQGMRGILTSTLAFVNSASAGFYGVTASGQGLTEVELGPERPGILTRLGFLAQNATLNQPDPIHRGVDVLNRLMCADLVPPDGTIPELPSIEPGQTNRQRVEAHTGSGSCAGCHATLINPIGFAFENFDAMGQLRTMDNGNPVDTTGQVELSDGLHAFGGAPELVALLADAPNVHGCYTKHLAEYTLARDMAGGDRALVDAIEGISMNNNAGTKAMVLAIISQPSFLTRTGGAL
jgi:hypothetical protein